MDRPCSIILLGNKSDSEIKIGKGKIKKEFDITKIDSFLEVSAKTGEGFDKLVKAMVKNCQHIKAA